MHRFVSFACILFGLVGFVTSASAEKRVALVIGNDRYANLPILQKAGNDAEAVGERMDCIGTRACPISALS